MNAAVNALYAEYLEHTGGDKNAAASLVLAAVLTKDHETPPQPGRALTTAETALRLHVSPWTIYRLARTGELCGCRVGRILRFPVDEIERFERENETARPTKPVPSFFPRHTINRRHRFSS